MSQPISFVVNSCQESYPLRYIITVTRANGTTYASGGSATDIYPLARATGTDVERWEKEAAGEEAFQAKFDSRTRALSKR